MRAIHPPVSLWVSCVLLIACVLGPQQAHAQSSNQCVDPASSSHCGAGRIDEFWAANGGASVFGVPTSVVDQQAADGSGAIYMFTHARLAVDADNGMVVGQLGAASSDNPLLGMGSLSALSSLDHFWRDRFAVYGWRYRSPSAVIQFAAPAQPTCGPATLPQHAGPFYCVSRNVIYIDQPFLKNVHTALGDVVFTTAIAHEWGHHVQILRGIAGDRYTLKQRELQADCLAGVYMQHAVAMQEISGDEVRQAHTFVQSIGARQAGAEHDPHMHGTAEQRDQAFSAGLLNGVAGCGISDATPTAAGDPAYGLTGSTAKRPARLIRHPRSACQPL